MRKKYEDTIEHYEIEVIGLGDRFNNKIKRALRAIKKLIKLEWLKNIK